MKVKKFRIKPRIPTVKKNLKALLGTKELSTEVEETVQTEALEFVKHIIPVATYQTWKKEDIPNSIREKLEPEFLKKSVSISVLMATIGAHPEEEISQLLMNGDTTQANILTALAEESADLSFNFLMKLLVEDAQHDDCEIPDPLRLNSGPLLSETIELITNDPDGVAIDQAGHLSPRFSRVGIAVWVPVSRKKKNKNLVRKR